MSFEIKKGTGKTYCRLCGRTIEKGQIVIVWKSYGQSGQVHYSPEDCEYAQKRLEEIQ